MPEATATLPEAPPRPRRRRFPSPARTVLGLVLVAMAAGQLSDMAGFARLLAGYRFGPDGIMTAAAWALAVGEGAAGLALLRGRAGGGTLALAVALAWTVLGVGAFTRGLSLDNCGCFGVHLGQPLRWWVLLQDAEFVALAAWVRRAEPRVATLRHGTGRRPVRSTGSGADF